MDIRTKRAIVLIAIMACVYAAVAFLGREPEILPGVDYTLPETIGRWHGTEVDFDRESLERWLGTQRMVFRHYRDTTRGASVTVYVAYYADMSASDMAHEPEVCYPGQGWEIRSDTLTHVSMGNRKIPVKRMIIEKDARREVVYSWWQTSDRVIPSNWSYRLYQIWNRAAGKDTSSLWVRVSAEQMDGASGPPGGDEALVEFCSALLPVLDGYFRRGS